MNDTLDVYNSLMMLKRIARNHPDRFNKHKNLEIRKDIKSNNILVICRTKKDCKEAMNFIAKDNLGRCEIHSSSNILKIDGTTIKFISISMVDELIGYRYKEYYFEEEFNI